MTQGADEHIRFMNFVLIIFVKCFHNFFALIGDNFASNIAIANKIKLLLISCLSHCFQLAVNEFIAESIIFSSIYSGLW